MGIDLANKINADVVFGTDPDSDRLGVALKNEEGEFVALSGNQVGILLLDYILTRLAEDNAYTSLLKIDLVYRTVGLVGVNLVNSSQKGTPRFRSALLLRFVLLAEWYVRGDIHLGIARHSVAISCGEM